MHVAPIVYEISLNTIILANLDQPLRVGTVGRAYHQNQLAELRNAFDGHLAVLGRIADILRFRSANHGESFFQTRDDIFGFIQTQRRLSEVGNMRRVVDVEGVHVFDRFDEDHLRRRLAQSADHFVVILVADQDNRVTLTSKLNCLQMHFRYQRAGSIDDGEVALLALLANLRRYAVRAENGAGAGRYFLEFLDEDCAQIAEFVHDVLVVHDFLADIDRRPIEVERYLDHVDGAHHAGAKTAGLEKVDLLVSGYIRGDWFEWHRDRLFGQSRDTKVYHFDEGRGPWGEHREGMALYRRPRAGKP